jgi:hypothetical protein
VLSNKLTSSTEVYQKDIDLTYFTQNEKWGSSYTKCKEEDTSRSANVQQKTVISPKTFGWPQLSSNMPAMN